MRVKSNCLVSCFCIGAQRECVASSGRGDGYAPLMNGSPQRTPTHSTGGGGGGGGVLQIPLMSGNTTPRDATAAEDGGDMSSSLSNKLLHVAFASLSLTDKCALSLSIGQLSNSNVPSTPTATLTTSSGSVGNSAQKSSNYNSAMNTPRGNSDARSSNSSGPDALQSSSSTLQAAAHTPSQSHSQSVLEVRVHRVGSIEDDMSEMHSVLSESDKESLDVAMSMMGQTELNQVEDEVSATDV